MLLLPSQLLLHVHQPVCQSSDLCIFGLGDTLDQALSRHRGGEGREGVGWGGVGRGGETRGHQGREREGTRRGEWHGGELRVGQVRGAGVAKKRPSSELRWVT